MLDPWIIDEIRRREEERKRKEERPMLDLPISDPNEAPEDGEEIDPGYQEPDKEIPLPRKRKPGLPSEESDRGVVIGNDGNIGGIRIW